MVKAFFNKIKDLYIYMHLDLYIYIYMELDKTELLPH